jgi:hypothetical protein
VNETRYYHMRYYIDSPEPESVEFARGALIRLEDGAPWIMAEYLAVDGVWRATETLARYHLRGSNEPTITEATPERAREIVIAWQARGRINALPMPWPVDDGQ